MKTRCAIATCHSLEVIIHQLVYDISVISSWYEANSLVANPDKFQLLFLRYKEHGVIHQNRVISLHCSEEVKLLGVIIENQLSFYPHIKDICKKVSCKTKIILRIRSFLNQRLADTLFNAYILSAFRYCPLIWIFSSKQVHNLISATHFRALRAKHNDLNSIGPEIM